MHFADSWALANSFQDGSAEQRKMRMQVVFPFGLDLLRCDLSQKGDMPVHAVCSAGGRPDLQFERRAPPTCMELAKGAAQSEGASHCMTLAHSSEAIKRACVGISP